MDIAHWKETLERLPLGAVHIHAELGSTNDLAEELVLQGTPHLTLVLADLQTQGRGRQGRSWITRPGKALAFSLVLRPPQGFPAAQLEKFSGLAALALAETLQSAFGLPALIKWPNDVLVHGRKVAGVLVELHWAQAAPEPALEGVVIGVGVNVRGGAVTVDDQLNFPAASLEELSGQSIPRLDLLVSTLQAVLHWYPRLGDAAFLAGWDSRLAFRGQQVLLRSQDRVLDQGELLGLAPDGSLMLRSDDGETRTYTAGEIQLRPAAGV